MKQSMCTVDGCENSIGTKGAKGMCPKHYRANRPSCTIDGCGKVQAANGMCGMHYYRARTTGDPHETHSGRKNRPDGAVCNVEGCGQPQRKRKWCASHYSQWRRTGEVRPFVHKWGEGGYGSAHKAIYRERGKASDQRCVDCGRVADEWSYDGTDTGEMIDSRGIAFSRDVTRYEPRCVPCHRAFDDWPAKVRR